MDKLQAMATALAASIAPHLDKPTTPPIKWSQEGEIVHVVLADGRMFEASIQEINALMFSQGVGAGVPPALKLVQAPASVKEQPEKPVMPRKRGVKK